MKSYQIVDWGQPLQANTVEKPKPSGNEVLVKVEAAGLCHSDIHLRDGYFDLGGGKRLTAAQYGAKMPMTLGHEIAGTVVEMGESVTKSWKGSKVLVYPWIGCGQCDACFDLRDTDCEAQRSLGAKADGGFSEYVLVPDARYLIDIGDLDIHAAATLACSGLTALGALKKMPPMKVSDRILLIGAGGLGLSALAAARLVTNAGLVVADIDPVKLDAARRQGADVVFDNRAPDTATALKAAAGGPIRGVIDFVGSGQTASLAMGVAVKGTVIVIVGLMGGSLEIALPLLSPRNLTIRGSHVGTLEELKELVAFSRSGQMSGIPLSRRPMSEVNEALSDLEQGRSVGRIVLTPD
ncbi:MAG: alcohol dehydrogenase [Burkholderiaceae bacterium]|jgi:propanol-preferring alcohol dehydrogenase